jgi:RimJ/RimL family protein N-acetyltransferase
MNYFEKGNIGLTGVEKDVFVNEMMELVNDDTVTHYMVTGVRPANRELLEEEYASLIRGNNIVFTIMDLEKKEPVGFAGLYNVNRQARHAEFRIIMASRSHGKGIGTTVTEFLVAYAFEKLNLHKVWLGVNVANKGAERCYVKAGFERRI